MSNYCGNCGVPLVGAPSECMLCGHQTVTRAPISRPPNLPLFHKRFEHDACLVCGEYHGNNGLPCPSLTPTSSEPEGG